MPSRAEERGDAELCCVHVLTRFEMLTAAARLLMMLISVNLLIFELTT